jgi:hypothetical protein
MTDIKHIHRQAMEQSDLALVARMKGDAQAASRHSQSAYELESRAASALLNELNAEPARSVLFRSAATLARDCGLFSDAEKLIYKALAGEPPTDIAGELHDLLEEVSFHRHLELRNVTLSDEEIQMAITGKSVGFGMAPTDVFLSRVQSTENLLYRIAERMQKRPYRDRGRRDAQLVQNMELYMTVPRAACFAVTFRVGGSAQQSLPGFSPAEEVIDELLECLQLYQRGEEDQLKARIKEEPYYRNFVGLARTLQPDGEKVNMVGFTTVRRGSTKQVALTPTLNEPLPLNVQDAIPDQRKTHALDVDTVRLRGEFQIANARKRSEKQAGEITIVTSGNVEIRVVVPPGMMSDIVKPLWESEVEVIGTRKGKRIHLIQIKAATD